jgi:hypothetical protein
MCKAKPEQTKGPAEGNKRSPRPKSRHGCREFAFLRWFLFLHVKCILWSPLGLRRLDLDLAETVLPDGSVGGDTVITEVNQDVPRQRRRKLVSMGYQMQVVFQGILTWHHRPWRSP